MRLCLRRKTNRPPPFRVSEVLRPLRAKLKGIFRRWRGVVIRLLKVRYTVPIRVIDREAPRLVITLLSYIMRLGR